jgi:NTE family protein
LTLGVALGGGFARGIAHVGVLKVLEEENIPVDYVAGTSVGAIIGAAYCSGMTAAELEEAAFAVRFRDFGRLTLSRYGFYNSDRMVRLFARVLKCHTFEELKIPLAIAATEFRTGEAVVFTKGPLADPIRASCAYPGMFLPVEIEGRSYIDGMLAYGVPTTPLRKMGADCVIGSYLSSHLSAVRPPRHIFEVIGQCFSIAQLKLSESWLKDADLVIEPDVCGFSYDCFERTPELIAAGEAAMRAMLPALRVRLNLPAATGKLGLTTMVGPPVQPSPAA